MSKDWKKYREKIIGLGDDSFKKSYYPELQNKINELQQANLNFKTIFESTSDGIMIHDKEGRIYASNPEAIKIFNISEDNQSTYNLKRILNYNDNIDKLISFWNEASLGSPQTFEWVIQQNETNIKIPVQISINSTIWNGQHVLVAVIRDFTERKKFEQELIKAKERASESDKLKSAFLANMSHEIRTPMNGILGFANLLTQKNLPEGKLEFYSKIIIDNGNQLLNIVDDILDISMIESNTIKLKQQHVNINNLIDELYTIYKLQNTNSNIELSIVKSIKDEESIIITDQGRLNQVLSNLINNALKFTKEGSVHFGYHVINNKLQFFVKDTGIGISKDLQQKVFERFRQANLDYSREYGGNGLGLSLSKRLVELLGGKIWIESEENKGSTFYFTIPINSPLENKSEDKKNTIPNKEIKPLTVLVVEDEEVNFQFIKEILSVNNPNVIWAKNGKQAIEKCKNNPEIDIVLMDIRMPVMNGYESTKEIKKIRPELPVIAQTAYAMSDDLNKVKAAGCDDYISKPINIDNLLQLINKYQ